MGSTVPSRPTPEQKCVPVFFGRGEKFARQTRRNAQVCLVLVLGMHGRVEDDDLRAFGTLGAPPPSTSSAYPAHSTSPCSTG